MAAVVLADAAGSAEAGVAVPVGVAAVLVDAAAGPVDAAAGPVDAAAESAGAAVGPADVAAGSADAAAEGSEGAAVAGSVVVPGAAECAAVAAARPVLSLPVPADLAAQLARYQGGDFALTKLLIRGPAVQGEAAGRECWLRGWRGAVLARGEYRRLLIQVASAKGDLGDPFALCGSPRSMVG